MKHLVFCLCLLLGAINGYPQRMLPRQQLVEDFDYLIDELRLQHQGLYQYVETSQIDRTLDSLRRSIPGEMTRLEFYALLWRVIALTNEGHTSLSLPKRSLVRVGVSRSFLPLAFRACGDAFVITQYFGKDTNELRKGDRLVSIDGHDVETVLAELCALIPTDGFNQTSAHAWIGGIQFSLLYRLIYGKRASFDIEVERYADHVIRPITLPAIRFTRFKSTHARFAPKQFSFSSFTFDAIDDSIAYVSIPSFGSDELEYDAYYESVFRRIDSLGVEHLILDLQANRGGTEGNENLLFSYLSGQAFQKYRRVTMLPKPYEQNKNDADYLLDKWQRTGDLAERGTFTLSSTYYSNLGYQAPQQDLRFDGDLYVLISGETFSGGAEFASMVKMRKRGIFIGEETGGTYEGNVSGYNETIKLPHSLITVDIPTVHFQINVSPTVRGRGIMPDITAPQTWTDYIEEKNSKLTATLRLIRE